jgi:prepilin-type N-terminal cleavage/methylation domain-containing protein
MGIFLKEAGFTLIEMIMTIVVLGILLTGVYVKWPGSTINLGGQAAQLANDLRYTQSLSMTKDQRYRLVIVSSTTYQILNASGTAVMNAMGGTTTTLNRGITFGTLSNLPSSLVAFDGVGIPYTTTAIPGTALSSTASIPLTAGGSTKTVTIAPQTGMVSVQ